MPGSIPNLTRRSWKKCVFSVFKGKPTYFLSLCLHQGNCVHCWATTFLKPYWTKLKCPLLLSFNFIIRNTPVCLVVFLLQEKFTSLFWHPSAAVTYAFICVTYAFIWVVIHVHCMIDDLNFFCWFCNLELLTEVTCKIVHLI